MTGKEKIAYLEELDSIREDVKLMSENREFVSVEDVETDI